MFAYYSNAFVEAMNGLLHQVKRAARGYKTAATCISIAYQRMGKLTHQQPSPSEPAMPRDARLLVRRCDVKFHAKRRKSGARPPNSR